MVSNLTDSYFVVQFRDSQRLHDIALEDAFRASASGRRCDASQRGRTCRITGRCWGGELAHNIFQAIFLCSLWVVALLCGTCRSGIKSLGEHREHSRETYPVDDPNETLVPFFDKATVAVHPSSGNDNDRKQHRKASRLGVEWRVMKCRRTLFEKTDSRASDDD